MRLTQPAHNLLSLLASGKRSLWSRITRLTNSFIHQATAPPVRQQEFCPLGYYVYSHCMEYDSTTCDPCPITTYTDEYNGWTSCKSCTHCDSSAGVRVKEVCTPYSDTLCEPLEGHYCTDPIKDGCQRAVRHTKCKPGQYIKMKGTASSDTICNDCGSSTYSDGSFPSCIPHT
ncbi:tumor necrosis factor receptor superfamily member 14-like, partial [Engraulis encrasicolus]|uniref:tumor necrosis factor receptor superfamily member 14-like n=1 Tax=Engraulis encrasicolus TaxID=184585 RepID=UPI002FD11581